jgi:hypothetical protein
MGFDTDSFIIGIDSFRQLLWELDRTNLRISFLTQVSRYKEYKEVYQSRDTGPSNSASKTTNAWYT